MQDEIIKKAEDKAKEELKNIIREDAVGYQYCLEVKMKKILKEWGIEWEPPKDKNLGKNIN